MYTRWLVAACFATFAFGQTPARQQDASDLSRQVAQMAALIERLERRVDQLEAKLATPSPPAPANQLTPSPATPPAQQITPAESADSNLLRGTSINFLLDGYYGYNFNQPIGRVNRLRAYDVLSNAYSLNQADVVVENAPNLATGKRWGVRIDLQFGQATQTLQGNAANEPRPEIYRNIFQAYGTYIAPIGNGLTIDFGKWASSLGIENNFAQDQLNYSRSFWFDFLPFYHMGARLGYPLSKTLTANYWITNGTQQTEPFNQFKDQFAGLTYQPNNKLSWSLNYYLGQEHPDVMFLPNSTNPALPTLQGVPFLPIAHEPKGKLHIIDSYATWQATPKLTLAAEADYVIERLQTNSAPARTWGGAAYARYQLTPRVAIAGRTEYLSDHGGLFTGVSQALKETTLTFEQRVVQGFLLRQEFRREFSNQPYFFTQTLGPLKREQNTATIGVVWWFGPKKSPW